MKEYNVRVEYTITVKAETEEEAIDMAYNQYGDIHDCNAEIEDDDVDLEIGEIYSGVWGVHLG